MLRVCLLQVPVDSLKDVKRTGSGEELGVVLLEEGAIVLNIKALPGTLSIFSLLAILGCLFRSTTCAVLTTLGAFFFAFAMSFRINKLLAASEVSLDLLVIGHSTLHPSMCSNLVDGWTLLRVECHHLLEEVFELSRVKILTIFCFGMSLPEKLRAVGSEKSIVGVLRIG